MRALRQKLNSQRGASILIAMVFFLLCLTVGAVVLTAATANAGRLASRRQEEQNYLTVSSAARLLRDELAGAEFQVVTTSVYMPDDEGVAGETSTDAVGLLEPFAAQAREVSEGTTPASRTFQIDASGENVTFATVSVTAIMDHSYNLSISVCLETDDGKRNPMLITVTAAVETTEETIIDTEMETETSVITTTVTWGKGVITKGAGT